MKDIVPRKVLILLVGLSAWVTIILFKGFSPELLAMVMLFILLVESLETIIFPYMLGLLLISILAPQFIDWVVLVGASLAIFRFDSVKIRYIAFVAILLAIWFSSLYKLIPFLLFSLTSLFITKKLYKTILLILALLISAFWTGLPESFTESYVFATSEIENGRISYRIPSLNLSKKKALLVAPSEGSWLVCLSLEGGGVRDTLPMYSLQLGEEMLFLPSGLDTLCFTLSPGDTLTINLMREFHPFNHPVVHATASGELL